MKRPNYRRINRIQIIEQNPVIEIISVNIMQMDNIRSLSPQLFDQPMGSLTGSQPVVIEQTGLGHVLPRREFRADPVDVGLGCSRRFVSGITDPTLPSGIHRPISDGIGDFSRGSGQANIDLEQFRHLLVVKEMARDVVSLFILIALEVRVAQQEQVTSSFIIRYFRLNSF